MIAAFAVKIETMRIVLAYKVLTNPSYRTKPFRFGRSHFVPFFTAQIVLIFRNAGW